MLRTTEVDFIGIKVPLINWYVQVLNVKVKIITYINQYFDIYKSLAFWKFYVLPKVHK